MHRLKCEKEIKIRRRKCAHLRRASTIQLLVNITAACHQVAYEWSGKETGNLGSIGGGEDREERDIYACTHRPTYALYRRREMEEGEEREM